MDQNSQEEATPSNTTITLPTPNAIHAELGECRNPPRFIFYTISWDGLEDPTSQSKDPDIHTDEDQPNSVFCPMDAYWSIDRWRRDVVKCDDATDVLDPIQDADTPLPLLSFPHDHPQSTHPNTDSNGSEDEVQLWIHPCSPS